MAGKQGGKHDVCCLFVFRLIIHCSAATSAAVRQPFSMLNAEIPLNREALPFPTCAICAAELTKSWNRMQFLTESFGFGFLFLFFLKSAGFCLQLHWLPQQKEMSSTRRSLFRSSLAMPRAPIHSGIVGYQNLKQPCEKSVELDPSSNRDTCTANGVYRQSLINQSVYSSITKPKKLNCAR